MVIYDLNQASKVERLSSVFSPNGTLISAFAASHCRRGGGGGGGGGEEEEEEEEKRKRNEVGRQNS